MLAAVGPDSSWLSEQVNGNEWAATEEASMQHQSGSEIRSTYKFVHVAHETLVISYWHLFLQIFQKFNPYLGAFVSAKNIGYEVHLYLHLYLQDRIVRSPSLMSDGYCGRLPFPMPHVSLRKERC